MFQFKVYWYMCSAMRSQLPPQSEVTLLFRDLRWCAPWDKIYPWRSGLGQNSKYFQLLKIKSMTLSFPLSKTIPFFTQIFMKQKLSNYYTYLHGGRFSLMYHSGWEAQMSVHCCRLIPENIVNLSNHFTASWIIRANLGPFFWETKYLKTN